MKYLVRIGEREFTVEIDTDSVRVDGVEVDARLIRDGESPECRLVVDGRNHPVAVAGRGSDGWTLVTRGAISVVDVVDERTSRLRAIAGVGDRARVGGEVKAPMPGMVVRIMVAVGDRVEAGQGVIVLEAMKMENELRASAAGVVTAIHANPGEAVQKGTVLVELGPAGE